MGDNKEIKTLAHKLQCKRNSKSMIHLRHEGGVIKRGFNFYPLSDNNFGFLYNYGPLIPETNIGSKNFQIRYSKHVKKWYFGSFYRK